MKQRETSIAILLSVAAMLAASTTASAQVTNFSISTSGPHHVVQGRYFTFYAVGTVLAGTDEGMPVPTVTNLPPGATVQFPNMVRFCCTTSLYQLTSDNPVRIVTSSSTPVGTYTVQLKYTTVGGVTRSVPYTVYVDPVPVPPTPLPVTSTPPLTGYDLWKANAATYGLKHCTPAETSNLWQGNVWYYDGARVYYQITDLTGDHTFDNCAAMVEAAYSQYVNANNGGIPGYTVFALGLAMRYQRFNDPAALQTLSNLMTGAYENWPNAAYTVDWSVSREVSYAIDTNLVYQSVGGASNPHLQDLVEALFGHFDQWFLSKSSSIVQPFMVALASEALIGYWNQSHDPRVLPMLQLAADQLWAQSWSVPCQCMVYYNDPNVPTNTSPAADLNGLIAPLYGWVFQQTGQTIYRDRGDQIFNGSQNSWLDGGKQFSQTYRWSGNYVTWRNGPVGSAQPAGTLSCDLNGDSKVNVLDVQLATNQALGTATCGSADLVGNGTCTIVDVQRVVSASLGATCHLGP